MKIFFFILAVLSLASLVQSARIYNVTARRYNSTPIIANSTKNGWKYNYNAAAYNFQGTIELIVRCQDLKVDTEPFNVGPSYLAPSLVRFDASGNPSASQPTNLAFVPDNTTERCGTEDPRITYNSNDGLYYLFYTAYNCTNAMLSLAVAKDPADANSWTRYGYVFPEKSWSKSGAALFADKTNNLTQHYLFWGDSSYPQDGIGIALSNDGIHWNDTGDMIIRVRSDKFDSALVESGPSPLQLSTGDFLFIYNSARHGYPSVKPAWDLQYNIGYLILNGSNPLDILERSDEPIMSPEFDWETGNGTEWLTPFVVFLEGLVPDPNGCTAAEKAEVPPGGTIDCFFGVYGGSDSDLGAVRIIATSTESSAKEEKKSSNVDEFIEIQI